MEILISTGLPATHGGSGDSFLPGSGRRSVKNVLQQDTLQGAVELAADKGQVIIERLHVWIQFRLDVSHWMSR